jgi:rhamnosyltransferase subunit B
MRCGEGQALRQNGQTFVGYALDCRMTTAPGSKPKAVLATFGTHGDLHPMLALAIALKARGVDPVLAAADLYRGKVEAEGISFHAMRPNIDAVASRLGLQQQELAQKVAVHPEFLIQQIIMPHLREAYEDVMATTQDADIVITQSAAYGARVAADKRGLPHVGIVLQPMILMSIYDPPIIANLLRLSTWIHARGPLFAKPFLSLGRALARRWAQPIEDLRRELGLPRANGHPLFEGQLSGEAIVALFSPLFGRPQPDHPPQTHIEGFAFYDSEAGGPPQLDDALEQFLSRGSPPIVFTQGTSAVHDAEDFIRESLRAMTVLGTRAVFVLDAERAQQWRSYASASVFITGYAPYSKLFPRALANVHHGGVGTTAQALRAGRPQLVAPYLVDQPDNAARVVRLGVGRTLELAHYRAERVLQELRTLTSDIGYAQRAIRIGEQVAKEDGAGAGADLIVEIIARTWRNRAAPRSRA